MTFPQRPRSSRPTRHGGRASPEKRAPQPQVRPDERIHSLAILQHGVVTRRQLLEAGILRGAVEHRLKVGRLRRLHQGVYQVGPVLAPLATEMAAVLACGDHAVLSHGSAAALWKFADRPERLAPVDVTVPRGDHRRRAGIRVHRPVALPPNEVTRLHEIPLTTPARTILDLARREPPKGVERALAEALVQGLTTRHKVAGLLARYPRRPGAALLRTLLEEDPERALTRSDAEERFRDLMKRARLPKPESNVLLEGRARDFVWRGQRLVVEVDGFRFHSGRARFERDRRRDADLVAAGFRVVRVTWRQLQKEPEAVVASIAQALAR